MKIDYVKEDKKYEDRIAENRSQTQRMYEKYKGDLLKRKQKSQITKTEVLFCTMQEENTDWLNEPVQLENKAYEFSNINQTKLGKQAILTEDQMYELSCTFWYVNFNECIFQNVKFKKCRFVGCKFNKCKTQDLGVVFEECYFDEVLIENTGSDEFATKVIVTEFVDCWFTAKFRDCKINNAIWERCTFILCCFDNCLLKNSIYSKCGFYSVSFNDSDISGIGILNMQNAELEFYGQNKNNEFERIPYIGLINYKKDVKNKKSKDDKENAKIISKMYYTLLNCNGISNADDILISEYKYQYEYHKMKGKRKRYLQLWDRISWFICGFGEKFGRYILALCIVIVIFGIVYMFTGIKVADRQIQYVLIGGIPVTKSNILKDLLACMYFSIITMLKLGEGNTFPVNQISIIVGNIQAFIGIIFTSVFTAIVVRKIIR